MSLTHHRRIAALWFGIVAVLLTGCSSAPRVKDATIPRIPVGEARIWFYRTFDPAGSLGVASVTLNGGPAIDIDPNGAAGYRDVPPGPYRVQLTGNAVDPTAAPAFDLRPGQEAFVKVTVLANWLPRGGGDMAATGAFGLKLVPPEAAWKELADLRLAGPI